MKYLKAEERGNSNMSIINYHLVERKEKKMAFKPKTLDYELSPYTGLTRQSWIEAGEYMLNGVFQNIAHFEDPVVMPRKETKVTYPHLDDSEGNQATQRLAEVFEGLTRTLFIAAPLIHDDPELTICGYNLRDYYKNQIIRVCTKTDPLYIGDYEDQVRISGSKDPFRSYQQTVETCALVICLWITKEAIWDAYTKEERDTIATLLSSYAKAPTVPQNWRLFNMLDMAFLDKNGYPIDHEIMMDHTQSILNYYVGDGWYRDGTCFDYYSCWAFNVYTAFWNEWYGYEKAPYAAAQFEEHSNKLMETYADFFDKDGFTNMWGRSNIYRNAATSAFDGNCMMRHSTVDYGLARRISSGSLLQFLTREDFLYKGVPTLGFYGQFEPLVQGYSCAESPFWLGKAFLCLHLPADHPFWTAKENNGTWDKLGEKETKVTVLNGPALCFSNHQANGETVLRSAKVVKAVDDVHGMWNYSKVEFNTKYPWESTPKFTDNGVKGAAAPERTVEARQYVLTDETTGKARYANATLWHGEKDGVLYRRQFFDYTNNRETHWTQAVNLADMVVPYGILRADKMRLYCRPVTITLGSFGFPDNGTEIIEKQEGKAKAVILKGKDATGRKKQMAMTIYDGWDEIHWVSSKGTNPDSENSIVVYASLKRKKNYGYEPYVMISQVITKEDWEDFTQEELFPLCEVTYTDPEKCGGYGPVTLNFKDGTKRVVEFEGIEGNLQM